MARENKHRIPTDAGAAAWANPFASLDLGPLPPGPETPGPAPLAPPAAPKQARLLMRRETAHRGGKTVIVLEGFAGWGEARLGELLHDLKRALGCGGKVAGQKLELQGELAERLQPLLEARGFAVKRGW